MDVLVVFVRTCVHVRLETYTSDASGSTLRHSVDFLVWHYDFIVFLYAKLGVFCTPAIVRFSTIRRTLVRLNV